MFCLQLQYYLDANVLQKVCGGGDANALNICCMYDNIDFQASNWIQNGSNEYTSNGQLIHQIYTALNEFDKNSSSPFRKF